MAGVKRSVVLFGWICVFVCFRVVKGRNCTCAEINKCRATKVCLSSDICNIENVALGKPAYMKSSTSLNRQACMAVNGDTGTSFEVDTATGHTNCAESGLMDYSAWWSVDLGQKYTVSNITIYRRADDTKYGPYRMADLVLKVDNQVCRTFPTHQDEEQLLALPAKIDIQCDPPIVGQTIRLEKHNPGTDSFYYYINLCEVQVWGCAPGFYGPDCISECGHCANTTACDAVTGQCPNGCQNGWFGQRCETESASTAVETTELTTIAKVSTVGEAAVTSTNAVETSPPSAEESPTSTKNFDGGQQGAVQNHNAWVGPVVGAIVGGFVALGLIIVVALICLRRYKSKLAEKSPRPEVGISVTQQSERFPDARDSTASYVRSVGLAEDPYTYEEIKAEENKFVYDSLLPAEQRPDESSPYNKPVFKKTADAGLSVYYENKC